MGASDPIRVAPKMISRPFGDQRIESRNTPPCCSYTEVRAVVVELFGEKGFFGGDGNRPVRSKA